MKQLRLSLSVMFGVILTVISPVAVYGENIAAIESELIITEIKIKNDTTTEGYDEFIEIYNSSAVSLNLNLFTIEYYNSPVPVEGAEPIKKVVVADKMIGSGKYLVMAANPDQIDNSIALPFTSLSDSGGLVRLADKDGSVQDEVAWTATSSQAIDPVLYLAASTTNRNQSFNRSHDEDGNPILTGNNWQMRVPEPLSDELQPVPAPDPEAEVSPEPGSETTEEQIAGNVGESSPPADTELDGDDTVAPVSSETAPILPLRITELLPNPAAPASDSTDEYIEIYNPNVEAVDLNGYKIQTGNSYSYSYTFSEGTILPNEYKVFYVIETDLLLANSSGRARLLGPDSQIIYETDAYGEAKEGQAWSYVAGPLGNNWQWTTTLTPGAENVLTLPLLKALTTKNTSTKSPAKPKAAAKPKKATAAKKATTTKPKTAKTSTTAQADEADEPEAAVNSIHPGIVAGIGALAVGYGLWEYRHDARNRLYQFRRYRAARRAARIEA